MQIAFAQLDKEEAAAAIEKEKALVRLAGLADATDIAAKVVYGIFGLSLVAAALISSSKKS